MFPLPSLLYSSLRLRKLQCSWWERSLLRLILLLFASPHASLQVQVQAETEVQAEDPSVSYGRSPRVFSASPSPPYSSITQKQNDKREPLRLRPKRIQIQIPGIYIYTHSHTHTHTYTQRHTPRSSLSRSFFLSSPLLFAACPIYQVLTSVYDACSRQKPGFSFVFSISLYWTGTRTETDRLKSSSTRTKRTDR